MLDYILSVCHLIKNKLEYLWDVIEFKAFEKRFL